MNRAIQDKHPRNRAKRFRALLHLQNTTVWKVLNENVVDLDHWLFFCRSLEFTI